MLTLGDKYTAVHFTILGNFVYVRLKFPMLRVKMDEVFRNAVHECLITEYQKENLSNVEARITKLHPTNSIRVLPKTVGP